MPRKPKADLNTKTGKYFIARQKGLSKKDSALEAGYSDGHHSMQIENTDIYRAIEKKYYKDTLLNKMGLDEIAEEHIKVIRQDVNLNAKNTAIAMALDKVEPEDKKENTDEKVLVILSN